MGWSRRIMPQLVQYISASMSLRVVALAALVGRVASAPECVDEQGYIGMIKAQVPSQCLEMCPQLCKPLGNFIAEFLASNDVPKSQICEAQAELDCAFEADHLDECKKLLSAASKMSMKLPTDQQEWDDYTKACNSEEPASETAAPSPSTAFLASTNATTTLAPAATCKGDNAMVEAARAFAEVCFEKACPGLCAAMEPLAEEFSKNQDKDAIEKQVCAAQDVFRCVLKPANSDACGMVVRAGKQYQVPQTEKELRERCGSDTRDLPDSELPTSAASSVGLPMEFAASLLLLVGAWQHVA